jgi:RNA polymerase sigma factor (sigma-70 family)
VSPQPRFLLSSAGTVSIGLSAVHPGAGFRFLRYVRLPERHRVDQTSSADPGRQPDDSAQVAAADHLLIHSFLRGDPGSDERIALRLAIVPRLLGGLCRRLGFPLPATDLEDVAQDAMLIALRKLQHIKPGVPLDAWLHRLCNFELSNALRRRMRQRSQPLPDDVVDPSGVAVRQLERSELVLAGLEQLPPLEATIIRLHQLEGLTLQETSRRLGITENSVKGRYYRALTQLTAILRRHRPGHEDS